MTHLLSDADINALIVVNNGAPLPEFRAKGYRGNDGDYGVARSTLDSLRERELVELRLEGVLDIWLITEAGARLLTDVLVSSALQGPQAVVLPVRCVDCWAPAERVVKLPRSSFSFVALCAACHARRLSPEAGAHILGDRDAWVAARRPERDLAPDDVREWGLALTAGPTDEQIDAERSTARCPCHQRAHAECPDAHPCIGRCGRLTTAHESSACGYCARCSIGTRAVKLSPGDLAPLLRATACHRLRQGAASAEGSPAPSITCPACGAVSHNKGDIEQRYCGRCHSYHEDLAQEPAAPERPSFFVRTVPHAPPRFWPGAGPALPADRLAEIRAAHAEEVPEGTPPSRMAWHERHQQAHQHRGELLAEVLRLRAGGAAPAAPRAPEEPTQGAAPAVQQAAQDLEVVEDERPPRHQRTPAQWLAGHDTTAACLRLGVTPPSPCLCDPCRYARRVLELEGAAPAAPRAPEEPAQGAAPAAALRLTVDVTDPSAPVVHSSWPLDLSREQLAAARATVRSVSKTLLERLKEQQPTAAAGESTPALATTPSSGPSPAAEEP